MTRFKLIQNYPNHKIGDIAIYDPTKCDTHFVWEKPLDRDLPTPGTTLRTWEVIPENFQPDMTPDWFEKIEEEKSLQDYEQKIHTYFWNKGSNSYIIKDTLPRIYWTEVLRCIAKDLNKSKLVEYCIGRTPVLYWRKNNEEPIRFVVTSDTSIGIKQGVVYFDEIKTCQKAIDLLGDNVKYLFND